MNSGTRIFGHVIVQKGPTLPCEDIHIALYVRSELAGALGPETRVHEYNDVSLYAIDSAEVGWSVWVFG